MRHYRIPLLLVVLLFLPFGVSAVQEVSHDATVAADQTVNDNYVRAAPAVDVRGTVNGDVIVAAQSLTVDGKVAGDVIAVAQTIHIRGTISGNVRLAANSVILEGAVAKNATIITNTIELGSASTIGWSLQAFGATLAQNGHVVGNTNFYGSDATLAGTVDGHATYRLDAHGQLHLVPPATVKGQLSYTSTAETPIVDGVTVLGKVEHVIPQQEAQPVALAHSASLFLRIVDLFGVLVVGLVLLSLAPKTAGKVVQRMGAKPGTMMRYGLLMLIVTPLAAILLMLTIIGIPLAVIVLLLYGIALYVMRVFVGLFLGNMVLSALFKNVHIAPLWAMVLGVTVFAVLTWIPILGPFFAFVGLVWSLGAVYMVKKELVRAQEK